MKIFITSEQLYVKKSMNGKCGAKYEVMAQKVNSMNEL